MEFNENLKELRKQKGLTQEELANQLFVSRTAISKWESGRGYPSIDSLKAISSFFSVTIDDLLSGDELLSIAQEDNKQNKKSICEMLYGLLDCSSLLFFLLPFFGQKTGDIILEVSLLSLKETAFYLKAVYFIIVIGIVATGILTLALQNCNKTFWVNNKNRISLILSTLGVTVFIISLQPYAAIFLFVHLIIKVLMLIKWR